eukprot:976503-Prymnesium_polylepis.1
MRGDRSLSVCGTQAPQLVCREQTRDTDTRTHCVLTATRRPPPHGRRSESRRPTPPSHRPRSQPAPAPAPPLRRQSCHRRFRWRFRRHRQ